MMPQPIPLFDTLDQLTLHTEYENTALPFARRDYLFANAFLHSYRGNQATFTAYRREIERLLQWCWLVAQKSLTELRRDDFEQYIEFCRVQQFF
jgi:uncharacterized membrane protein